MKLTPKIQKAINYATKLHYGQFRKSDKKLPYVSHCFSVAWIASNYTQDENIVAACLLHDTIEDVTGYDYEDLKKDFGEKIADIVKGVSENKSLKHKDRKIGYIETLKLASQESLLVSAADKIHNLSCYVDFYAEVGEKMWKEFGSNKKDILWFHENVLKVLEDRLDNEIVEEVRKRLEGFKMIL